MFLVADIGGTNARFALAQKSSNAIIISDFEKYSEERVKNFDATMNRFLDNLDFRPKLAVLAVAGPIQNGAVTFTNRNWRLDESEISAKCGIEKVAMLNDFVAMAYSVPFLADDSFITLKQGESQADKPILVAGPGTGFGSCLLVPSRNKWQALPCEGGHSLYTPRTEMEKELASILDRDGNRVSLEMICGGANLPALEAAMADIYARPAGTTTPAEIIAKGEEGDAFYRELCVLRARAIITGIANMALVTGAQGGVVISGGVARHLLPFINTPDTLALFDAVWPEGDFLQKISIRMLVNPLAPLIGAASHYMDNHPLNGAE